MHLIVYFLLYIFFTTTAWAQQPFTIGINKQKGLPTNKVYHAFQDAKGYMWFATDEGLLKYNGISFKQYKSKSLTSYAGSNIYQDAQGRIWYQNFDGNIYYTSADTLVQCNLFSPVSHYGVYQNYLWLVHTKGISLYNNQSLALIKHVNLNPSLLFRAATLSGNSLYIFLNNHLLRFNSSLQADTLGFFPNSGDQVPLLYAIKSGAICTFRNAKKGQFWQVENNSSQMQQLPIGAHEPIQQVAYIDSNYWVLTPQGCFIYHKEKMLSHWLNEYNTSSIIKDNKHAFWVTTLNKGIVSIPNASYIYNMVSPQSIQQSFLVKDKLYYINELGQVWPTSGAIKKPLLSITGNAPAYFSKFNASDSTLFISASGFYTFSFSNKKITHGILALKDLTPIDLNMQVLATSGNIVLRQLNKKHINAWSKYLIKENELEPNLYKIYGNVRAKSIAYNNIDTTIYAATNLGLLAIKPNGNQVCKWKENIIQIKTVTKFREHLLALSYEGELFQIKKSSLILINNEHLKGIQQQIISIKTTNSELILLTQQGNIYIKNDWNKPWNNPISVPIDVREIVNIEILNKRLLLVTKEGILQLPLVHSNKPLPTDNFFIEKVEADTFTVTNTQNELPHSVSGIHIYYALLNYGKTNAERIAYKINNGEWQNAQPQLRLLSLISLSPGNYTIYFKVNELLIPNATVQFTILSPIWLRWWFVVLIGFFLVFAGFFFYRVRLQVQIKQNQILSDKLQLERNLHQSTLTAIRSQMNPHFFFNALNTIQAYIFSNNKQQASHYLSMFSKLTRNILEMSGKERIKISEEIDALKLYLQLEQMRFEDNFNYEIKVDSSFPTDMAYIMPMLIQPYVENAIKHGLLHVKGDKKLIVEFTQTDKNVLTVTIDDNGIGRTKSGQLQQQRAKGHTPFATQANQKRLDILQYTQTAKVGISYIDKHNNEGKPTGTTVILNIPFT